MDKKLDHPVKAVSRRLPGNGLMLAASEVCPSGSPTVIFLPGGGQTRHSWSRALKLSGSAGMHGLAVDLRGHGDSEWPSDGDYRLEAIASDIVALVDHLDTPCILVGASRGGQASLLTAAARPQKVKSVVMLDVAPGANQGAVHEITDFMLRSAAGFQSIDEAITALKNMRGETRAISADSVERNMRRGENGLLYWHWDPRLTLPDHLDHPRDGPILDKAASQLRVPVLLLHGELSDLVDARTIAHFRRLAPQLETIEVRGAGHMLTDDQTDIFVDHIQEFIRSTAGRPTDPELDHAK